MDPKIHFFDSTGEAYDSAMCSDEIKDGDILIVKEERVIGVLIEAWPSAVTFDKGQFHCMAEGHDMRTTDDGKYAASHALAVKAAQDFQFTII